MINKVGYKILQLSEAGCDPSEIAKALGLRKEQVIDFLYTLAHCNVIEAEDYLEVKESIGNKVHTQIPTVHIDLRAPIRVAWLITHRCNLMCKHCYISASPSITSDELALPQVKKILERIAENGVFIVYYTGGEPFVRKDFMEILKYTSMLGLKIGISTNGLLLNDDVITELAKLDVIKVQVSLDGASKETHEFIRGPNTFEHTISNIKKLVENNIDTGITFVCHKGNAHELRDVIRLALRLQVKGIKISPLMPWGRAREVLNEYVFSSFMDRVRLITTVNSITKELGINLRNELYIDVGEPEGNEKIYGCPLVMGLTILPNGDVIPCEIFAESLNDEVLLGNLINQDISDIWNSPKAKMFRDHASVSKKKCYLCPYLSKCGSYCIAEMYLKYRRLTPPLNYFKECRHAWSNS
jgi:radical SAM protein with 4Fe4S-binding SPASM domain